LRRLRRNFDRALGVGAGDESGRARFENRARLRRAERKARRAHQPDLVIVLCSAVAFVFIVPIAAILFAGSLSVPLRVLLILTHLPCVSAVLGAAGSSAGVTAVAVAAAAEPAVAAAVAAAAAAAEPAGAAAAATGLGLVIGAVCIRCSKLRFDGDDGYERGFCSSECREAMANVPIEVIGGDDRPHSAQVNRDNRDQTTPPPAAKRPRQDDADEDEDGGCGGRNRRHKANPAEKRSDAANNASDLDDYSEDDDAADTTAQVPGGQEASPWRVLRRKLDKLYKHLFEPSAEGYRDAFVILPPSAGKGLAEQIRECALKDPAVCAALFETYRSRKLRNALRGRCPPDKLSAIISPDRFPDAWKAILGLDAVKHHMKKTKFEPYDINVVLYPPGAGIGLHSDWHMMPGKFATMVLVGQQGEGGQTFRYKRRGRGGEETWPVYGRVERGATLCSVCDRAWNRTFAHYVKARGPPPSEEMVLNPDSNTRIVVAFFGKHNMSEHKLANDFAASTPQPRLLGCPLLFERQELNSDPVLRADAAQYCDAHANVMREVYDDLEGEEYLRRVKFATHKS